MNKNLYKSQDDNAIRMSAFEKFEGETTFHHVAAKFVIQGQETYIVKGKKYVVKQGEYIIGNNEQLSEVLIMEKTLGLCVDISSKMITEILSTSYKNQDFEEFLLSDRFLINKYCAKHTNLGGSLGELARKILEKPDNSSLFSQELFYNLGEHIIIDQSAIFEQYSKLNFHKQWVNEENYRKMLCAKQYIDETFLENPNLDTLLCVANMSKYAFIRLFKIIFGLSPYQYTLNKRLEYAKNLLEKGEAIHYIALVTNFADTPTFSKAFKQLYGVSPSKLVK